jgi:hypothetical protein
VSTFKIIDITERSVTIGWPDDKIGPFKIIGPDLDKLEIAIRESRGKKRANATVSPSINPPNAGPTQILGR